MYSPSSRMSIFFLRVSTRSMPVLSVSAPSKK
jgi:hypothetical protein